MSSCKIKCLLKMWYSLFYPVQAKKGIAVVTFCPSQSSSIFFNLSLKVKDNLMLNQCIGTVRHVLEQVAK